MAMCRKKQGFLIKVFILVQIAIMPLFVIDARWLCSFKTKDGQTEEVIKASSKDKKACE